MRSCARIEHVYPVTRVRLIKLCAPRTRFTRETTTPRTAGPRVGIHRCPDKRRSINVTLQSGERISKRLPVSFLLFAVVPRGSHPRRKENGRLRLRPPKSRRGCFIKAAVDLEGGRSLAINCDNRNVNPRISFYFFVNKQQVTNKRAPLASAL